MSNQNSNRGSVRQSNSWPSNSWPRRVSDHEVSCFAKFTSEPVEAKAGETNHSDMIVLVRSDS